MLIFFGSKNIISVEQLCKNFFFQDSIMIELKTNSIYLKYKDFVTNTVQKFGVSNTFFFGRN